jgi:hypothetical protein
MTTRQWLAAASPIVLIVTMIALFRQLTIALGFQQGYFCAFAVYWIGWCVALPVALLGPRALIRMFGESRARAPDSTAITRALVWWPVVFPLMFAFLPRVGRASGAIIGVSIALGVVTGVAEEIFWRGLYLRLFPDRIWWNTFYPSFAFGLWHVAPLSVLPSRYPGGIATFVAYSMVLGLSYASAARRTGSIRWCTIGHCVHDALGLGGFAYATWLT